MNVIAGKTTALSQELLSNMARYRYKVFVETLGWDLDTVDNREWDQFDQPDTLYVISKDGDDAINGCARLLPTSQPYLLGTVFPELMQGQHIPSSPDVWELSRFAAVDFNKRNTSALAQFSACAATQLLREAIDCAASHGAKRLITVSPIGIERLLRHAGVRAHRAGPPMIINGHALFACWIEL
ncbi:N-acylhomoserine lactone synthase [Janthinobacterium sp. ROICE36]|uniref:acyl-homoserine-lactone synthase n=1 Tax=Janthinobacterium sp. ROICE36 TaxID=2048670 RepID=UPI000C7EC285|nr:acyl-homoserine-lactone synthase [Janthinobacterium sp. ROICE36]PLY39490.1 N-acylhomoserine lactone synthase [Janthinobacterium sp. ROICE36]